MDDLYRYDDAVRIVSLLDQRTGKRDKQVIYSSGDSCLRQSDRERWWED